MEWFNKYGQTTIVLLGILTSVLSSTIWMNGKFNELEKDITIIKTVLIMKNIMPIELANKGEN